MHDASWLETTLVSVDVVIDDSEVATHFMDTRVDLIQPLGLKWSQGLETWLNSENMPGS